MAERLETKVRKAVLGMAKDVRKMTEILYDVGMKLTYVIERRFDYHSLPKGIDYNGYDS
jgi:hypothetical protein